MKVLHVTTHFNVGGITKYILNLAKAVQTEGVEVIVASSGGDLEPGLKKCGIRHLQLNIKTKFEFGPKAIISGFKIAGIIKNEKIDLLHAHTRVSQVASAIASAITGVPVVTTCHGYFKKRSRALVDTWGVKVIAISDAVRMHLRDDLGVSEPRIKLIYSGVDADRFSRVYSREEMLALKRSIGLRDGPVIGTIGRLSSIKGQKYLIMAFREVMAERGDTQCVIVGSGPEESALKDLAGSMGVYDSVKFIESCDDTHRYLSMMDVFVFPSIKEGLGIALLEALASGRACVASRIGGIEDIITDGRNGILIDVENSHGIADAILRLLDDDVLRKKIGEEGRAMVRSRFTLNTMADNITKLYRETAGE